MLQLRQLRGRLLPSARLLHELRLLLGLRLLFRLRLLLGLSRHRITLCPMSTSAETAATIRIAARTFPPSR